ncbi:MAG: hypothetical protein ACI8TA_002553 [Cyclobacteriaceae bacterium]|jgi:hypothetical protein
MKYAAICCIFLIVVFHFSFHLGINPLINIIYNAFDLVIFAVFIVFAIKDFKTDQKDGVLYFWQGMTMGFNIYFFSTIVFIIYISIFLFYSPDVVNSYKLQLHNVTLSSKDFFIQERGEAYFNGILEGIDKLGIADLVVLGFSPPSALFKKILIGLFITPFISIILRKQPK